MTRLHGAFGEARAIAGLVLAAALTTAALHLTLRAMRHVVLNEYQPLGPDVIWMAPLAELAFFFVAASPFLLASVMRPTRMITLSAVFVLSTVAAFFIGLQTRWIHPAAAFVLALGVGWQLRTVWRSRSEQSERWTWRVAAAWGVAFTVAGTFSLYGTRDRGTSISGTTGNAPNVLLLILDTVGAKHLSLYGYERETSPILDEFAKEGVVFDRAIAPSSWTLPSHASLFTGVPASALSARWLVPLDETYPTLAEAFADRGYRTAGFTANLAYTLPATGVSRGFQYYRANRRTLKSILWGGTFVQTRFFQTIRDASMRGRLRMLLRPNFKVGWEPRKQAKHASHVTSEFLRWQSSVADAPFLAFLNFFDAHHPYDPPDPFPSRYASNPSARDAHDGAIAYIDREIGAMLDTLRHRGVLDETIVVITSDHGEAFGEHGLEQHGGSLYRELVHVPLVIRYPRTVPAGIRYPGAVSLTDVGATLLELADTARPVEFPGQSLSEIWRLANAPSRVARSWVDRYRSQEPIVAPAPRAPTDHGDLSAVIDDRYALIVAEDGTTELFDHHADPNENDNVADNAAFAAVRSALHAILKSIADERVNGRS